MTSIQLKYTAYHEAGHAVIALRLGYEIRKFTIVRRSECRRSFLFVVVIRVGELRHRSE